jgi:predicted RNase H-like HicB family nuclease
VGTSYRGATRNMNMCCVHWQETRRQFDPSMPEPGYTEPEEAERMADVPEQHLRLTAAVTRDGAWYVAQCLEVEVASQGPTVEAALANLQEALALYFEDHPLVEPLVNPSITPVAITVTTS